MKCDLLILGSDDAGFETAFAAAKLGERVAMIIPPGAGSGVAGGESLNDLRCPPRILHAAVQQVLHERRRTFQNAREDTGTLPLQRLREIVGDGQRRQWRHRLEQLARHGVQVLTGVPRFASSHCVEAICSDEVECNAVSGPLPQRVQAERIVIATGTRPPLTNLPTVGPAVDLRCVVTGDRLLQLPQLPRKVAVIAEGPTGLQYGTILADLGIPVTLLVEHGDAFDGFDNEVVTALLDYAEQRGMQTYFGGEVLGIGPSADESAAVFDVTVHLNGSKPLSADVILLAGEGRGNTDDLHLDVVGLKTDERGRLWCDAGCRTWREHIFAVGSVVGFPTDHEFQSDQGIQLVQEMYGASTEHGRLGRRDLFTSPAIAMAGPTEEQLLAHGIPYQVGTARIEGSSADADCNRVPGLLKLLFHRDNHRLLAVHCLGENAAEYVQVGHAVMALNGSIDVFSDSLFNDPAIGEHFQNAARNGYTAHRRDGHRQSPVLSVYHPDDDHQHDSVTWDEDETARTPNPARADLVPV